MSPSATFCRGAHVTSLESAFVVFSDSASESFKLQKHNDQCQSFPKTTLETYANTNRINWYTPLAWVLGACLGTNLMSSVFVMNPSRFML